ncbi:MAG: hypothetical protein GF353_19220 [Candidatus Lokiarchaeota archaeon]|nr:hypothetical protein [Candidatus Lokiarchaeota archaeon]
MCQQNWIRTTWNGLEWNSSSSNRIRGFSPHFPHHPACGYAQGGSSDSLSVGIMKSNPEFTDRNKTLFFCGMLA